MTRVARRMEEEVVDPENQTEARFAAIVDALARTPGVTHSNARSRLFGRSALKAHDKIFAMVSSHGEFVVKLPKARVDALVAMGAGERFDVNRGRPMKEWFEVRSESPEEWLELAREAPFRSNSNRSRVAGEVGIVSIGEFGNALSLRFIGAYLPPKAHTIKCTGHPPVAACVRRSARRSPDAAGRLRVPAPARKSASRVSSDPIWCVQRSDRSTTTSLNWSTGAMSV